jgi:hypothetical protein
MRCVTGCLTAIIVATSLGTAAGAQAPRNTLVMRRADAPPPNRPPYSHDPGHIALKSMLAQLPPGTVLATIPDSYRLDPGTRHLETEWESFAIRFGDVDGDGQRDYVLGCYFPAGEGSPDGRARIVVFKKSGKRWLLSWTSPGLGYEFDRPRYNAQEVETGLDTADHLQSPLELRDLGGDGRLSIVFFAWSQSTQVGGLPGIYRSIGGRWRNVAPQADRFTLRDLNGDGHLEVIAGTRYVGYGSGDDDVPRVYRWEGERFEEASSRFPRFYAELARIYRDHVRRLEEGHQPFPRDVWERAIRKAENLSWPS